MNLDQISVGEFLRLLMVSRHRANQLRGELGFSFDVMLGQAAAAIRRVVSRTDQTAVEAAIAIGRNLAERATIENRQTIELQQQMLIIAAMEEIETVNATDAPADQPKEPQR